MPPKKIAVKALSKIEVVPLEAITAKEHSFKTIEKKSVNFKIQKLNSPNTGNRGWSSAFAPVVVKGRASTSNPNEPKIVILPQRMESQALKDKDLPPLIIQPVAEVVLKAIRVLSEKEERMLAAKILAQKNKCYLSIGIWKSLGQDEEALTCLVHDQYDDVAMMNLKDPKSVEAEILLSRLGSLQISQINGEFIRNSESIKAQAILAFEKGDYKLALQKAEQVEMKKDNFKVLMLKPLSLSNLNQSDTALSAILDLEKLATDNDLTVLNVLKARLYLKMQKPEDAMAVLQQMPKEHPLWLESMQDLGWAQLQAQDFSGAIGNMYSLHTPYFRYVYQPQSYVVRTIGYLNLCQYGDAYRSLTEGEQKAQAWSAGMQKPMVLNKTVKNYVQSQTSAQDWPLPTEVLRELARNRSFINLQKEINRLIASQAQFKNIETRLVKTFNESQERAAKNQKELKKIIVDLKSAKNSKHLVEAERLERLYTFHEESYYSRLFEYQLAKNSLAGFKTYLPMVEKNYSTLYNTYENRIEDVLQKRFKEMTKELAQIIDQNEFLRYEIFAGSGEDIRYQAAGGVVDGTSGRLPSSYRPSKSLQWTFDGEIWEDEIGHYRSSLINNCPKIEKAAGKMPADQPQGVSDDAA